MSVQTILGSGGTIGKLLAKDLKKYTDEIRLVARNPQKINETDELKTADLLKAVEVMEAVDGSDIVYMTAGLPYFAKVWERDWPVVVKNIIEACSKHQSKLVFFDNMYMYDKDHLNRMDENTPINPPSRKGKVRADIAKMVMDADQKGEIKALIARSADFYGPGIDRNGMVREMIFKNLAAGKKANWLCSLDYKHSVTYTPDAAKATAILGNSEKAYGQIWHLPTAGNPPTGGEWIEMIAEEMKAKPKSQVATKIIVSFLGWFTPIMREMKEMLYQYDRDYVFDSSKFEKEFDFTPTTYEEGIRQIVTSDYSS